MVSDISEASIRQKTIGSLTFENKESKNFLENQALGFRKVRDVLIPFILILIVVVVLVVIS